VVASRVNDPRTPRRPAAVASLVLLALAGCAAREPSEKKITELLNLGAPNGQELYRQLCASCHGTSGTGDGPLADQLKAKVPDLTRLAARDGGTFPRTGVRAVITGDRAIPSHGPLAMPVWGRRLAPYDSPAAAAAAFDQARDVTAIVDYLASIQRTD